MSLLLLMSSLFSCGTSGDILHQAVALSATLDRCCKSLCLSHCSSEGVDMESNGVYFQIEKGIFAIKRDLSHTVRLAGNLTCRSRRQTQVASALAGERRWESHEHSTQADRRESPHYLSSNTLAKSSFLSIDCPPFDSLTWESRRRRCRRSEAMSIDATDQCGVRFPFVDFALVRSPIVESVDTNLALRAKFEPIHLITVIAHKVDTNYYCYYRGKMPSIDIDGLRVKECKSERVQE